MFYAAGDTSQKQQKLAGHCEGDRDQSPGGDRLRSDHFALVNQ